VQRGSFVFEGGREDLPKIGLPAEGAGKNPSLSPPLKRMGTMHIYTSFLYPTKNIYIVPNCNQNKTTFFQKESGEKRQNLVNMRHYSFRIKLAFHLTFLNLHNQK